MSQGFNDGGAVYGSQKVTATNPTGAGAAQGGTGPFVAKNIKVGIASADRKTTTDELGNENKQWFTGKIPTGTLSLQFPDASTASPAQYATIPLKPAGGGDPVTFIIYEVGETYEVSGETMCDVSVAKKMAA